VDIKVNDTVIYKRKHDYAESKGRVLSTDGINLFMINDDLKIRTTCKITDVINVEIPTI
jgi:hypothetical protein